MEYRYLGNSGLKVSALSLGAWVTYGKQVGDDVARDCIKAALDAGVNFLDNAEVYAAGEAERVVGRVLKQLAVPRSEIVVSTKIFWGGQGPNQRGLSRKHIVEGLADALERLQLDYVDLLFCHRPDPQTPIEETVRAMSHCIDRGNALYWGTSEWSAQQISEAQGIARRERLIPPTMEQPEYHMFHRARVEREYAPLYRSEIGLGLTTFSPLGGGLLTGKYNDGVPEGARPTVAGMGWLRDRFEGPEAEARIAKIKRLAPIAAELDCTMAQLALAWCLSNRRVSTVITGASRPEQLTENLKALEVVERLDEAVTERIEQILDNRPDTETDFRSL